MPTGTETSYAAGTPRKFGNSGKAPRSPRQEEPPFRSRRQEKPAHVTGLLPRHGSRARTEPPAGRSAWGGVHGDPASRGPQLTRRRSGRLVQHVCPAQVHRAAHGAHQVGFPRLKRERHAGCQSGAHRATRHSPRWRPSQRQPPGLSVRTSAWTCVCKYSCTHGPVCK